MDTATKALPCSQHSPFPVTCCALWMEDRQHATLGTHCHQPVVPCKKRDKQSPVLVMGPQHRAPCRAWGSYSHPNNRL